MRPGFLPSGSRSTRPPQAGRCKSKGLYWRSCAWREIASIAGYVQAQNFPRLALGGDFERTAADLAIHRKALRRDAGVHGNLKGLAAEWTLNGFGNFHIYAASYPLKVENCKFAPMRAHRFVKNLQSAR